MLTSQIVVGHTERSGEREKESLSFDLFDIMLVVCENGLVVLQ